jgi:serpin B
MEDTVKYLEYFSILAALSLFLSACGGAAAPGPSNSIAKSDRQRIAAPDAPASDLQTLVNGNNAFALDLYQSLRDQDGNLFYSPFSISLALAMTYAGARGKTETQMANVLHFDLPQTGLHPAFNALDQELTKRGVPTSKDEQPMQPDIANAIWAQKDYAFLQDYLDLIAGDYGAGIRLADFINQAEAARIEINNWVSDKTNDKIKDLIPQGALDAMTRMVLVNAIYFKADWQEQFEPESTADAPFHLLDGSDVTVPMMSGERFGLPYAKGDGYQAIELPYKGGTAAMDILLPDQGNFDAFEASLEGQSLDDILNDMQPTAVKLHMPKFKFSSEFNLSAQLSALGMSDAFDPNYADFSGMTGNHDLFISDVIHKAFVAVDEKGTEAAAATAVIMKATSAPLFELDLTIDHPFIFVIRDLPSGQILFVGRVLDPTQ